MEWKGVAYGKGLREGFEGAGNVMFPSLGADDIGATKHKLSCVPKVCAFSSMSHLSKSRLENKPRSDKPWDTVGSHPSQPVHVLLLGTTEGGVYQKTS